MQIFEFGHKNCAQYVKLNFRTMIWLKFQPFPRNSNRLPATARFGVRRARLAASGGSRPIATHRQRRAVPTPCCRQKFSSVTFPLALRPSTPPHVLAMIPLVQGAVKKMYIVYQ